MNKKQIEFLLKYAKIGILESKKSSDDIEYREITDEYISIKKELTNPQEDAPVKTQAKTGEKKDGAVVNWFKGIGDRQKKFQETKKEGIV